MPQSAHHHRGPCLSIQLPFPLITRTLAPPDQTSSLGGGFRDRVAEARHVWCGHSARLTEAFKVIRMGSNGKEKPCPDCGGDKFVEGKNSGSLRAHHADLAAET